MMNDAAIRVEGLGKQYRIGLRTRTNRTFGEMLTDHLAAPFRSSRARVARDPGEQDLIWALRDVSFEIARGEVVGVIGANGAGKSTLLKILSRITEPTTGRAELRGSVGSLLEVGTGFHPELTGRENIYLNGAILGMKKAEIAAHFDEIVAFAELEHFLDTPVKRYSSGMYVRLAFAVAAHLQPEILIVDEVLAVGDVAFQKKCLGAMREVSSSGRTVLFVSHQMAAITHLCSRAMLLTKGRVVFEGAVNEAVKRYLMTGQPPEAQVSFASDPRRPMQLNSLALETTGGCNWVDTAEGATLRIGYCVRRWIPGAYVTLSISNDSGVEVLWTCDAQKPDELQATRSPGNYVARVRIPPRLLPAGSYCASTGINDPGRGRIYDFREHAIRFDVADQSSLLSRLGIKYPSAVALPVPWTTETVSAAAGFPAAAMAGSSTSRTGLTGVAPCASS
jgi:lipopolysaccharide transport system ATP-binding protein